MGGVHKLNEINSLTQLHIISHKTVEIIKMKMFVASSRNSMVDTTCTMPMHTPLTNSQLKKKKLYNFFLNNRD